MSHRCKEKNKKLEIKKMSFKNIILICEIETNLKEKESIYLLLKIKKIINKQFKELKVSSKKLKYKKIKKIF